MDRRRLILTASGAALALAVGQGRAQPPAHAATALIRREITAFEQDDGALQTFRDAVHILRAKDDYGRRPALDGWHAMATNHNLWCFGDKPAYEIHFGWWFLPWHRAYLIQIEQTLQEAVREPKLRLPYWDWIQKPTLPQSFTTETYRKGSQTVPNPLFDQTRFGPVGQGSPVDFIDLGAPGRSERELLTPAQFERFGGGQPDPSGRRRPGSLEATPHNYIHRAIGYDEIGDRAGNMVLGLSPLDPAFMLHHGNLDRLWKVWLSQGGGRENPRDRDWLGHHFAFPRVSDFEFADYTVADLVNTETSPGAYRYDRERLIEQTVVASGGRLTVSRFSLPARSGSLEMSGAGVPIEVPDRLQQTLSAQAPQSAGAASVVLEGVPIPSRPTTVRVFAQPEGSDQRTLLGSFSLLPAPKIAGRERTNVVLPVPEEARQLLSQNRNISLTGETVGTRSAPLSIQSFSIEVAQ